MPLCSDPLEQRTFGGITDDLVGAIVLWFEFGGGIDCDIENDIVLE